MVAYGGAEAAGNVIPLIARDSVQKDKYFVARRVHDDIIAAKIAANQLDDLLPKRRGLTVVGAEC